jgi:hypothetical protein
MYEMHPITLNFPSNEEHNFYDDYFEKSKNRVRACAIIGGFLYAVFGILDALVVPEVKTKIWLIRYGIICPFVIAFICFTFTSYFKKFMQASLCIFILIPALGIVWMTMIAPSPGNYLYYSGLILIAIATYTFIGLRFAYASIVSITILLTYEVVAIWANPTPTTILISNNFFFLSANILGMFACYFMELYVRKDFIQRQLLKVEEEKTEELLLNILPKGIVERLKWSQGDLKIAFSQVIVDKFSDVSILFADIVEFTDLSSRISAEALVVFLSELFYIFDNLAEKHGLEKIKTIGDAYLVVGGLPDPRPDHAEAIAEMALDMEEEVAKLEAAKEGWLRIRIGIHTGSVVAGVIGRKKFTQQLFIHRTREN